jgi:hypothetical protein
MFCEALQVAYCPHVFLKTLPVQQVPHPKLTTHWQGCCHKHAAEAPLTCVLGIAGEVWISGFAARH